MADGLRDVVSASNAKRLSPVIGALWHPRPESIRADSPESSEIHSPLGLAGNRRNLIDRSSTCLPKSLGGVIAEGVS
jgi:hypothetical protein